MAPSPFPSLCFDQDSRCAFWLPSSTCCCQASSALCWAARCAGWLLPDISMVSSKLGCRGARSGWIMSAFPIYAGRRQSCSVRVLHSQLPTSGLALLTSPTAIPVPSLTLHGCTLPHSTGTQPLKISHSHHSAQQQSEASFRAQKPLGKAAAFGAKPRGSNVP